MYCCQSSKLCSCGTQPCVAGSALYVPLHSDAALGMASGGAKRLGGSAGCAGYRSRWREGTMKGRCGRRNPTARNQGVGSAGAAASAEVAERRDAASAATFTSVMSASCASSSIACEASPDCATACDRLALSQYAVGSLQLNGPSQMSARSVALLEEVSPTHSDKYPGMDFESYAMKQKRLKDLPRWW